MRSPSSKILRSVLNTNFNGATQQTYQPIPQPQFYDDDIAVPEPNSLEPHARITHYLRYLSMQSLSPAVRNEAVQTLIAIVQEYKVGEKIDEVTPMVILSTMGDTIIDTIALNLSGYDSNGDDLNISLLQVCFSWFHSHIVNL